VVATVLFPLQNLVITGPRVKWTCPEAFRQQFNPLLAALVRNHPVQLMVAQVSYGLCRMCQNAKGVPMARSTFRPLDNSRDQHIREELLDGTDIHILHTLRIHPLQKNFCQFTHRNVYQLSQPVELHQLLWG